ncbi:MAG TPA: zinc-dependent alcohol dehydrogenase family protein [Alphaproteobacteria bacterium]
MKIKAAVLYEMGQPEPYAQSRPVQIEELDLDGPGAGEVLVKVAAAGLCHSDLSVINGARPRPLPMVLGHEASGVVAEVGAGVADLKPGDHVVFVFVPSCGHCVPCAEGRPALCEPGAAANAAGTLLAGGRRLHKGAAALNHQVGVSCFAEYATVSRRSLVKVDRELGLEEAALFGCAVITGVGAVVNTARLRPGASVAVVGLGGVGLNALLGARMAGARRIVAIDLLDDKLALARQLGANDTFNAAADDVVEAVRAATGGGADYAFEMVGNVKAMELAYRITRRGGETVSSGLSHPDHSFSVQHVNLVGEERTIKGSYLGSCVPQRDIPNYIALYQQGRLPVDRLMSERVGLDEVNEAFDRLASGHTVRQLIVF